jgi:transcriptional regulator with XRE-family HTH domain
MGTRGQGIKSGEYEKKYGLELRIIRSRNNIKREDVAQYLDVTLAQYCKYENGKSKISIATEQKIANFFGIKRSELVKKIEEQMN